MKPIAEIWAVSGLQGTAFATKGDAEKAAKDEFPNESLFRNEARVYFVTLYASKDGVQDLKKRLS